MTPSQPAFLKLELLNNAKRRIRLYARPFL
jgi:hypothetical protein